MGRHDLDLDLRAVLAGLRQAARQRRPGLGTRTLVEGEVDPDFHPIYQIVDGEILDVVPPAPDLHVLAAERFVLGGQEELWVATSTTDFDNPQAGLYARVNGAWIDRQPPGISKRAISMTQGGQRVFAAFGGNTTSMFEAGVWTSIDNNLNASPLSLEATGKYQLWMTGSVGQADPNQEQLYYWGGAAWNIAKDLFPQIAGYDDWQVLSARAANECVP